MHTSQPFAIRRLPYAVLIALALVLNAHAADDLKDDIEQLLSADGVIELSDEAQSVLKRVLSSPDKSVEYLEKVTKIDRHSLESNQYALRFNGAIGLLAAIGSDRAIDLIVDRFDELWEMKQGEDATPAMKRVSQYLINRTVTLLGSARSDRVAWKLLAGLEDTDGGSYHVYLQYLETVGPHTQAVADVIRSKSEAMGREDWAITRRALATIEARAAGPIANGNDDEPAIGPSNERSDALTGSRPTSNTNTPDPINQTEVSGAASTSGAEPTGASALLWAGGAAGLLLLLVGAGILIQSRRKHVDGAGPH